MIRCRAGVLLLTLAFSFVTVFVTVDAAQDSGAPVAADGIQPPQVTAQEVADLKRQLQAAQQQIAQLQQQTKPTAAQQLQASRDGYASVIKDAKERVEPGCKAAGGRWTVMISQDGKASAGCIGR